MQTARRQIWRGALAGLAATGTMSATMLAGRRLGLLGTPPPERVAAKLLRAVGRGAPRHERVPLAVAGHFAFGAALGAAFALMRGRLRLPLGAVPQGIAFGSLVWWVSYRGWVPALGILPPPEHDRPGRPATMLVAHWVFGATLGMLVG